MSYRPRPGALRLVGAAAVVLAAAGSVAGRGVGETEARTFQRFNAIPDALFGAIWVPMQYGSFGTVQALSGLALLRRRSQLAVVVGAGGTAAWLLAKAIKPIVNRERPQDIVARVALRGREEGGLGFPSGHAAVSAALTAAAWPYVSTEARLLSAALAAFVPFARMYVGAHLPLDVIGGTALGLAIGPLVSPTLGVGERKAGSR